MRIAVASVDGRDVAAHLFETKYFLIFQVDGDCVGAHIKRPVDLGQSLGEQDEASALPITPGTLAQRTGQPTNAESGRGIESEIQDTLLRAFADCNFLLAGAVTEAESAACARLGVVALPVPGFAHAREAVAFVVTGHSQGGGECRKCIPTTTLPTLTDF
jgi:hypothetical protein